MCGRGGECAGELGSLLLFKVSNKAGIKFSGGQAGTTNNFPAASREGGGEGGGRKGREGERGRGDWGEGGGGDFRQYPGKGGGGIIRL